MKKTLIALACCTLVLSGCKTPEERAMDQLDAVMKQQVHMMERMQQTLEQTAEEMEKMENSDP